MKIKIIDPNFDKKIYNDKAVHPVQSWEWGVARTETGVDILRLGEYKDEQLINVYLITFHKIPYTNFKVGYLPRSKFPSKELLHFLYEYGHKHNVIFFKIEPYVKKNDVIENFPGNLQVSPHPLFTPWTQILDITKSEEELLKNMHHKTRYNIRLAQRKGVTIREESTEKGFETFNKLYFETCKRQNYHGHTPQYHEIIWENLKHTISHILIAYYEKKPLAAYELFYFNKTFYYPYGGSSLEHKNVMAPNLLMWEAIKLGKKLGAEKFDMWGSLPPGYEQNDSWAGFTRFKEGYGTEFVELTGSYDLVLSPMVYKLYNQLHTVRKLLLKFI